MNSTLAAEMQSLSKGLGELCGVDKDFDLASWESQMKKNKVVAIAAEDSDENRRRKGSLRPSEQGVQRPDKRTGLEMQVVRQNMSGINVKIRWVPHARMVVDGLTKKSANLEALYDLMDTGEYQIVSEAHALQKKREERDERGYNRIQ